MADVHAACMMVTTLTPEMITRRRDFHKYAESGWTEFRTASLAARRLIELGYDVTLGKDALSGPDRMGVPDEDVLEQHKQRALAQGGDAELIEKMSGAFTAFWGDMVCGTGTGPTIAIRFDMDANDCSESRDQKHRPTRDGFASVNPGVMHACAHDGHTAVGLAVAEIVARHKDTLNGRVRLLFQPAEEGVRGAYPMVKAGAVKGVDLVLGLHIADFADTLDTFVCGAVRFLATTKLDAVFHGKSAQGGSRPEQGRNALLAATTATNNLYAISRHSGGPTRVCVGKITAGEGRNVVAPYARMVLETRGETSELNKYMESEARRVIAASAAMWGCTHEVITMGAAESAVSDQWTIDFLEEVAREMGVHGTIKREGRCLGSEDFTFMLKEVQDNGGRGSYCLVGSPLVSSHHSATMDWDEESMPRSAELLCRAVWKYLG